MTNGAKRLVGCPHCSAHLRVSTREPVIYCPRCKGAVDLQEQPRAAPPGKPNQALQEGEAAETTARSLGEYLKLYWRISRGGWWLEMYLATWAAIFLSFLKPLIGARGIIGVAGGVAALFVLSSLTFLIGRSAAYLIRRQRVVSEEATSRSARLAFASIVTLVFPFAPLAAVEAWGPSEGHLARNVPILKKPQAELVRAVGRVGFLQRLSIAVPGISNEQAATEVAGRAGKPETSASAATGDDGDAAGGRCEEREKDQPKEEITPATEAEALSLKEKDRGGQIVGRPSADDSSPKEGALPEEA